MKAFMSIPKAAIKVEGMFSSGHVLKLNRWFVFYFLFKSGQITKVR